MTNVRARFPLRPLDRPPGGKRVERELEKRNNVRITEYLASLALGLLSLGTAQAQDILPEAMPARPHSERTVTETKAAELPLARKAVNAAAPAAATADASANFGESVVKTALQYLGASYRSGMSGPTAFDCSGFTSFVYRLRNVPILRSSRSQFTQGTPIARVADLKKGDLVFFGGSGSSRSVGHVGIVTEVDAEAGNFSFVHAARGGVKISESNEAYYSRRYMGARRIVGE